MLIDKKPFILSLILILLSLDAHTKDHALVIENSDQARTNGHFKIDSRTFLFSSQLEQSNDSDLVRLKFGFANREITLIADSNKQKVELNANRLEIDSKDKEAYSLVSDALSLKLNPKDQDLAHNKMLIEMMRYFARAPIGFQPTPFDTQK